MDNIIVSTIIQLSNCTVIYWVHSLHLVEYQLLFGIYASQTALIMKYWIINHQNLEIYMFLIVHQTQPLGLPPCNINH